MLTTLTRTVVLLLGVMVVPLLIELCPFALEQGFSLGYRDR